MASNLKTIFQQLNKTISGGWGQNVGTLSSGASDRVVNSYNISGNNDVIFKTKNREEYEQKKLALKQQKLLSAQWKRANIDIANDALMGLNNIRLMYRDADLMDGFPEIGAALDIVSDETCNVSDKGVMVNVYSQSERIKAILEDLFINRLDLHVTLPMICRAMCKYGNQYLLLNINEENGVIGWKQLPVYEMERYDVGTQNPYIAASTYNTNNININETTFVWVGRNEAIPYRNWQIAHFRLLYDSLYLPYGISYLHKARRHWRMLSMMEDMMLIYRLERSIERRVYKIYVGTIDDADVPAFVNQIADNFKRTPIIDPQTGQIDLRRNILDVSQDFFIPVRDANAATPIDTLPAAQNLTAMDDIKFIQNKVITGLRMPRAFLNFEENAGDGKNLALMDIRFARTVNRIQQALLMELTKVATIHLFLLGFQDDLSNFNLTMNNPSSQAEMLEIENLGKKIDIVKNAVSDSGNGIPVMSWTKALKQILKWDDNEITQNLEEIRLEKALSGELAKTWDIIKRTKIFDPVDNIYGEPDAEYTDAPPGEDAGLGAGGGGGSFGGDLGGGDDLGGSLDLDGEGDLSGDEGSMSMDDAVSDNAGGGNDMSMEQPMEALLNHFSNKLLTEKTNLDKKLKNKQNDYFNLYKKHLTEKALKAKGNIANAPIFQDNFIINEEINSIVKNLEDKIRD